MGKEDARGALQLELVPDANVSRAGQTKEKGWVAIIIVIGKESLFSKNETKQNYFDLVTMTTCNGKFLLE